MKTIVFRRFAILLAAASFAMLVLTGCGGGSKDNSVAGRWDFVLNFVRARLTLTEENGVIGGIFEWIGQSAGAGAAESVSGTITGDAVSITITFGNDTVTTISATLDGDSLSGGASTVSPGSAIPQVQDFEATREDDGADGGGSNGNGMYSQYSGSESFTVTCCAPEVGCYSQSASAPMSLVVGPDGQLAGFETVAGISVSQTGNSITISVDAAGAVITWQGTIAGNTISGTISGGVSGLCTVTGSFNLTKTGEFSGLPPDVDIPNLPIP